MKSVGVKLLKARLSEYLRLVKAGEQILITDRDEVVAEIIPPRHAIAPRTGIAEILEDMAEKGLAQLRTSSVTTTELISRPLKHKLTVSSKEILDALRADS